MTVKTFADRDQSHWEMDTLLPIALEQFHNGNFETCRRTCRYSIRRATKHRSPKPLFIAAALLIGDSYGKQRRFNSASQWYGKAAAMSSLLYGENSMQNICALMQVALMEAELNHWTQFELFWSQIQRLWLSTSDPAIVMFHDLLKDLAKLLSSKKRYIDARRAMVILSLAQIVSSLSTGGEADVCC